MKVCGRMVDRYLRSEVDDMVAKNEKEILCPCRKCKEGVWLDPFKGGRLKVHLLRYGFMDGYTRWITEDDDDDIDGGKQLGGCHAHAGEGHVPPRPSRHFP